MKPFAVPVTKIAPAEGSIELVLDPAASNPVNNAITSGSRDDPEMNQVIEKMTTLSFKEQSRTVTNITQIPFKFQEFTDKTKGFKMAYAMSDDDQLAKLVPKERFERDIKRIRAVFNHIITVPEYTKQSKELLTGVWMSMPFSSHAVQTSPIATILIGDQHRPMPIYDRSYSSLEILYMLNVITEQICEREVDMLPPTRKDPKEYVADIQRSFKVHIGELQRWFGRQVEQLKKAFPELDSAFWSGVEGNDWTKAKPIKNIATQAKDAKTLTWDMLKIQILPRFQQLTETFTLAYINLCEAKILNCLGWITTFPENVAKHAKYAFVWPDSSRIGSADYLKDIMVKWRYFFSQPPHKTTAILQRLYWSAQLNNSTKMDLSIKQKLEAFVQEGNFDALWRFSSTADARTTVKTHLTFLKFLIGQNQDYLPLDDVHTWAGVIKSDGIQEDLANIVDTINIEKAEEMRFHILCAELQLFIHQLMYQ